MTVRLLRPGDDDEWLRLRLALWSDHTLQGLRSEMDEIKVDERQVVFVVQRGNGELGGFLEASLRQMADGCDTSPVGYIEGWYVDPDLRREGYGQRLVQAAETWARDHGCQEVASDCLVDNVISLQAHTALGYEEVERLIHFRKDL